MGGSATPAQFIPTQKIDMEDLSEEDRAKEEALQEKLREADQRAFFAGLGAYVKKQNG